jgi:serine protease AprX
MSPIDRRRTVPRWLAGPMAAFVGAALLTATTGSDAAGGGSRATLDPALRGAHGVVSVIVQGSRDVERAVRGLGGRVTHELPIIGGFSARVPANDLDTIARLPGAAAISLDRPTHVQSGPGSTDALPSVYRTVTGADSLNTMGARGQGVTVALIDTGVTWSVPDVSSALQPVVTSALPGGTVNCVNLTDDGTCDDLYGHGTFMAGLIAGTGASSNGAYVGMAPAAKILSVKVAGASGSSDVSTLIAALQWVVLNKATYNIRDLNLSLGTDSTQPYALDPLDFAVEKAWQAGIVVNVAASNRGPAAGTISDPANDPFVITVGAIDDKGTKTLRDDVLPNFSSRGPTASDGLAKPDVVAPGAHLVSLAAPGATITTQFPSTMPAPYRRGSGTSMATAVVTGLVADLLSAQPALSPDRVKYMLTATARPDASNDPMAVGAGVVNGVAALTAPPGLANVGVNPSLGTGSLAASRGTVAVALDDASQTVLNAQSGDAQTTLASVAGGSASGASWWGTSWWGTSWWGTSWWGTSWWGTSWWGTSWWGATMNGSPDPATDDYGTSWWGGAWYGAWDQ